MTKVRTIASTAIMDIEFGLIAVAFLKSQIRCYELPHQWESVAAILSAVKIQFDCQTRLCILGSIPLRIFCQPLCYCRPCASTHCLCRQQWCIWVGIPKRVWKEKGKVDDSNSIPIKHLINDLKIEIWASTCLNSPSKAQLCLRIMRWLMIQLWSWVHLWSWLYIDLQLQLCTCSYRKPRRFESESGEGGGESQYFPNRSGLTNLDRAGANWRSSAILLFAV